MLKLFISLLVAFSVEHLNAAEFDQPWKSDTAALIIDPYHANTINWDQLKTSKQVVAIIHKSTKGTRGIDPEYFSRRDKAKQLGYLWGSYHWGESGNPEKQADYYIDTVQPAPDELIALDLEDARSSKLMNADEALRFIIRVKERTGRYPVLYTNHSSVEIITKNFKNSEFVNCPLWYARFKKKVTNFPQGPWKTYTIWQFSSEITKPPPIKILGTKPDMDVNVYNGTITELKDKWPLSQ